MGLRFAGLKRRPPSCVVLRVGEHVPHVVVLRVGEHIPDVLTPRHVACFNS